MRIHTLLVTCVVCLSAAMSAAAQQAEQPPVQSEQGTGSRLLDQLNQRSLKSECKGDYCILTGQVELPLSMQTTLFADQIELFRDTNRVVAQGNVVICDGGRPSVRRTSRCTTSRAAPGHFRQPLV